MIHRLLAIAALALLGAAAPGEQDGHRSATGAIGQTFVLDVFTIPTGDILGAEPGFRIPAARAGQQKRPGADALRTPVRAPLLAIIQRRALDSDLPSCGTLQLRHALCSWTTTTPPPFQHT